MEQVGGIEGHAVRIGKQRLAKIDEGVPEWKFSSSIRRNEDLAQGILEIEGVPEVKVLRSEKDIGKEENPNEDQHH